MIATSYECWECGRPGTYWGEYALCDRCDTDGNRAKWEDLAAAVYYKRHESEIVERFDLDHHAAECERCHSAPREPGSSFCSRCGVIRTQTGDY